MRILFLDDMKSRRDVFRQNSIGHVVDFAISAEQCLDFLKKNEYDVIYLDHDLKAEHYEFGRDTSKDEDGSFVARKMRDMTQHHGKTVIVHSLNPNGRQNILSILKDLFRVYLGPEDFRIGEIWKVDATIVGQAIGLVPINPEEKEGN
jgi:CheY-like chemotaxis protein